VDERVGAFSSEVGTGSRKENASEQKPGAPSVPISSQPKGLYRRYSGNPNSARWNDFEMWQGQILPGEQSMGAIDVVFQAIALRPIAVAVTAARSCPTDRARCSLSSDVARFREIHFDGREVIFRCPVRSLVLDHG
jgi:hypothetical protein